MFHFQVDLIKDKIGKAILLFAIPIFISNIFQQLYNTMDTMIVGHVLGDTSLAAIGACSAVYDLLIGLSLIHIFSPIAIKYISNFTPASPRRRNLSYF